LSKRIPVDHCGHGGETALQTILIALIFAGILALGVWAESVDGHSVSVFAYVEDGRIHTESYFPDGKAVEGGTVEILDSRHQKLAEGVTDQAGRCVLPIPKVDDDLTIVINASLGHRSTVLLKKRDIGE
jgi:nickel transport protein